MLRYERSRSARSARRLVSQLVHDTSAELHGDNHRSAVTRALRLWQSSTLDADQFVSCIYSARRSAKQARLYRRPAASELGQFGFQNRMPYFFAVLQRMVYEYIL